MERKHYVIKAGVLDDFLAEENYLLEGELFYDVKKRKLYMGGKDDSIYVLGWFGKFKRVKKYENIV